MAFLNYEYRMTIDYSVAVKKCYFTIKSIPADDLRQRNLKYEISISPDTGYSVNMDSFGTRQIYGNVNVSHSRFEVRTRGLVETNLGCRTNGVDEDRIGMYKYPHGKCIPGVKLYEFVEEIRAYVDASGSDMKKCIRIMEKLRDKMIYEKGFTDIGTGAEEAFSGGKGVCQDFSHIYITLLRMYGIPARYVTGLIVGEGESHAWVEAAVDGCFTAFDPTHNREITDEYIKLGTGRDAGDCSINRGTMWGGGAQTQEIRVLVEKYC